MSLWTCHTAHTWIGLSLIAAAFVLNHWLPNDVAFLVGFPGFVMMLNGGLAVAYGAACERQEPFHYGVWWIATIAALLLNALFLILGWSASDAGVVAVVTTTVLAALASMQLSFLWEHCSFRNPQSAIRNR